MKRRRKPAREAIPRRGITDPYGRGNTTQDNSPREHERSYRGRQVKAHTSRRMNDDRGGPAKRAEDFLTGLPANHQSGGPSRRRLSSTSRS